MQLVGTDHCVFNSTQKAFGIDDFRKIPNGVNGNKNDIAQVKSIPLLIMLTQFEPFSLSAKSGNWKHRHRGEDAFGLGYDGGKLLRLFAQSFLHTMFI